MTKGRDKCHGGAIGCGSRRAFLAAAASHVSGLPGFTLAGTASSAGDALALVQSASPDVLLLDLGLAPNRALDLVRRVKATPGAPAVVALALFHTPEAVAAAKRAGAVVSYDLNYRPSLWKSIGGKSRAQEVNRRLAPLVDVMLGNEEDFTAALGFSVSGVDEHHAKLDPEGFKRMMERVVQEFPNLSLIATTLRHAKTATLNDWGAICYYDGRFYQAPVRENLEIFDRVGGGDSFASGLIYGFLSGKEPQWSVECGAAHGALAMTTPGDTTMAILPEVLQTMTAQTARIER